MPLHDWAELSGWDGVHQIWMVELLYSLRQHLPTGYRAYIGTTPTFAIGAPDDGRPDVGVRSWPTDEPRPQGSGGDAGLEPDEEVAVATINPNTALMVEQGGRLVAAIELVSPRNKDRHSAQAAYTAAYAGYLLRGVHLLLVDVHRKPLAFSFADRVAAELGVAQPPLPTPFAVGYRVGGPVPTGGRFVGVWRRPLAVGEGLPSMTLALSADESVTVDLDGTYRRASEAAYLG